MKPYLTNPGYHLRGSVFHVYARVGDATALRALQSAARSRNPDIRGQAFSALTLMQPLPASVNELLTQALKDPDEGVRSTVLARLAGLLRALPGADRQVWLPRLEPLLQSKSLRARRGAMQVLGTLVPEVPEAMPALITRLQDPDEDIRAEIRS